MNFAGIKFLIEPLLLAAGTKGQPAFFFFLNVLIEPVGASGWMHGALWWPRGVNTVSFALPEANPRWTCEAGSSETTVYLQIVSSPYNGQRTSVFTIPSYFL